MTPPRTGAAGTPGRPTRADRVEALLRSFEEARDSLLKKAADKHTAALVIMAHRERVGVLMHVLAITEDADLDSALRELAL